MNTQPTLTGLFTSEHDRTATQLAYKVRCFPWAEVPESGKKLIAWRRFRYLTKHMLLDMLDEDQTTLAYKGKHYKIVWAYGNTPTFEEWTKKSENFTLSLDLRVSPAIKDLAVAVLSFDLAGM